MSAQDFGDELAELFKTAEETSETLETSPKPADPESKNRAPRRRSAEPAAPAPVDVEEIRRRVTEEVTAGMASQLAALQEQLAKLQQQPASVAPLLPATSPFDPPKPEITPENSILIHFVDDGFTVGSQVFYRGQELRVLKEEGWAHLTGREQVKKFRKVYFRQGPWDGEGFDLNDPSLTDAERAKLMKVMESSPA